MRIKLKRIDREKDFDYNYFSQMKKTLSEYKSGTVEAYIYPPNSVITEIDEENQKEKDLFIIYPLIDRDKRIVFFVERFNDEAFTVFHSAYKAKAFIDDDVRFDYWMLKRFIREYCQEISAELGFPVDPRPISNSNAKRIALFKNEITEEDWKYFTRNQEYDKDYIFVPEWSERYPKAYQLRFKEDYFEAMKKKEELETLKDKLSLNSSNIN